MGIHERDKNKETEHDYPLPKTILENKMTFIALPFCLHLTHEQRGHLSARECTRCEQLEVARQEDQRRKQAEKDLERRRKELEKERKRQQKERRREMQRFKDIHKVVEEEEDVEEDGSDPLEGFVMKLDNDKIIQLTCVLFRSHGIIGRGTIVAEAKCLCVGNACKGGCDWNKVKFVVKISFQSKSREAENDFIKRAVDMAKGEHAWVKKHLPNVMHAEMRDWEADSPMRKLAEYFPTQAGREYEERTMRVIVQRKLYSLKDVESPEELAQVFFDIVQCHHWLYKYAGILHRDISHNNIMFWCDDDNSVHGVLNDFDLSSLVGSTDPTQRAGTQPFMAFDMFNPRWTRGHMYRHDLESLFYVMLCVACRHDTPWSLIEDPPYQLWYTAPPSQVMGDKAVQVLFAIDWVPETTEYFAGFYEWLLSLQSMLSCGYTSRPRPAVLMGYDYETLGGHITYEAFLSAMSHFGGKTLILRSGTKDKQDTDISATPPQVL